MRPAETSRVDAIGGLEMPVEEAGTEPLVAGDKKKAVRKTA
jgi:hypothetical protein